MKTTSALYTGAAVVGFALLLARAPALVSAGQTPGDPVRVDADDLGGVVSSAKGPEAGVWVIAETADLPTKFVKIVVTDDRGRYLLPDLPKANYNVWVRGYGLVDSPKVKAAPGKTLNLTAVVAPNPRAAAEYYPAGYWFSLIRVPEKSEFPGNAPGGNGISPNIKSQADWIRNLKSGGCTACHQLGTKGTREIPKALGTFHSSAEAWERRIQSGQAGAQMAGGLNAMGKDRALAMFADWTDRMAGGELPPAPPRPQGVERNVVITQWDWADPKAYLHDEVSTDRRNPTVNANGLIYGSLELSADYLPVLDPVQQHDQPGAAHRARSEHAAHVGDHAEAVAVLGRGSDLDQPEQRSQSDVRREGARVDHIRGAPGAESGFLQGRIDASIGEALSAREQRTTARGLRSGDASRSRTSAPASARTT